MISEAAIQLSKIYPWSWVFIGDRPWFVDYMDKTKVNVVPGMDIIDYMMFMKKISPAIQIVPLHPCDFNLKKSNIAMIEGTYAGAVTVAPDWLEWKHPGVNNYTNNFGKTVENLINNEKDLQKQYSQTYNYIKENLLLSKVNNLRKDLLIELLN